jgi:PH domain
VREGRSGFMPVLPVRCASGERGEIQKAERKHCVWPGFEHERKKKKSWCIFLALSACKNHTLKPQKRGISMVVGEVQYRFATFSLLLSRPRATTPHTTQARAHTHKHTPSSMASPQAQGDSLKEGWLNKQGGSIKTWKRRYFVLRRDTVLYYRQALNQKRIIKVCLCLCVCVCVCVCV